MSDGEPPQEDVRARLEALRREAQRRLAALTASRAEVIAATAGSNADDEHDPEGATLAFERQQLAALADRARAAAQEAEAALQRLDDGRYGSCAACGRAVGAERLDALPTAALCLRCAARAPDVQPALRRGGGRAQPHGPASWCRA